MSNRIVNYKASHTAAKFHASKGFLRSMMGPIGSGKSVSCCFELFIKGQMQAPSHDGIRRTRMVVVRNTLPQLETTTIKTWLDWFPEDTFGRITKKPPYTQTVRYGLDDGTSVEMEVIFLALDKPEDVKKLLSLECTYIWFNEAREAEQEIVDAATGRVGRYPSKKDRPPNFDNDVQWPTNFGVILDTNPPPDDSWIYKMDEEAAWRKDAESGILKPLESIPETERWEFFRQPSGLSEDAENIENLPDKYYERLMRGKSPEWIRVYVHGLYGFVQDGEPVYKNSYNSRIHKCEYAIPYDKGSRLYAGVDCSGRNPAAVFAQKNSYGQIRAFKEFVCEDMGAQTFSKLLAREVKTCFGDVDIKWWGDPAGFHKGNLDEKTYVEILAAAGIRVNASPVLRIAPRLEAVESLFLNLIGGGQPGLLISPECTVLCRGLDGGYKYRRMNVKGDARYSPEPEKNRFSDVQDALQYLACGLGAYRNLQGKKNSDNRSVSSSKMVDMSKWEV
jgi:hypothetical protein